MKKFLILCAVTASAQANTIMMSPVTPMLPQLIANVEPTNKEIVAQFVKEGQLKEKIEQHRSTKSNTANNTAKNIAKY